VELAVAWRKTLGESREALERLADAQLVLPQGARDGGWLGERAYKLHDLVRLDARERFERESTKKQRGEAKRATDKAGKLKGLNVFAFLKSIEQQGSWEEAAHSYRKLIKLQRELGISDTVSENQIHRSVAGIEARTGLSAAEKGDQRDAVRHFAAALDTLRELPGLGTEALDRASRGLEDARQGNLSGAIELWQEAVGELDPSFRTYLITRQLQEFLRDFEEREQHWRRMTDEIIRLTDENRSEEAVHMLVEQENLILQQIAVRDRMGVVSTGEDDTEFLLQVNYGLQVVAFSKLGNMEQAERAMETVRTLAQNLGTDNSRNIVRFGLGALADQHRTLALAAYKNDDLDDSRKHLTTLLALYEELEKDAEVKIVQEFLETMEA
jgi:tetratricopeptide (TPR) repeat protein